MHLRRFAAALLVVLACGKDGVDSGVAPDKPGSELVPAEQTSLCDATAEYLDAKISADDWARYMCTLEAFGEAAEMGGGDTAKAIAACKTLRDACVAAGAEEPLEFSCNGVDDWSMCAATVGEIEQCYEDAINQLDALIGDFTCNILDPAVALELQEKYGSEFSDPFPPSCDVVQQKCPIALGDQEDDEAMGSSMSARPMLEALRGR
jgi:hypothetical protein